MEPPVPRPIPLQLDNLSHSFGRHRRRSKNRGQTSEIEQVHALNNVTTSFTEGTWTAIMGPSGSGKSTLLHCAAGLIRPTEGSVHIDGIDVAQCSPRELTALRRTRVGFVFQSFNLVPALTAAQNIELPHRFGGKRPPAMLAKDALATVGLEDRAKHRPDQLSGGQQQRVAIARALALAPSILFADEPTGALDQEAGSKVLDLFRAAVAQGSAVVMVTHDHEVAARADRILTMTDGYLISENCEVS